jgi:glycerol uptake facilitator-like aquaporin
VKTSILGRVACEAAGTALLVAIGTGSIVESARTGEIPLLGLTLAWFLAVLIPISLFIRRSGAHLNPAVTLALAASGRIAWSEVPFYILGQVAGALLGSGFVLVAMGNFGNLGSTVPAQGDVLRAFPAELAFTAALVSAVFLLSDLGEGRRRWRIFLPPTVVAFATYVIGPWTGSSLNPARTLAPAILSGTYTDLWVYLMAAPLGALIVAAAWSPRSVDRLDRGPGRVQTST